MSLGHQRLRKDEVKAMTFDRTLNGSRASSFSFLTYPKSFFRSLFLSLNKNWSAEIISIMPRETQKDNDLEFSCPKGQPLLPSDLSEDIQVLDGKSRNSYVKHLDPTPSVEHYDSVCLVKANISS